MLRFLLSFLLTFLVYAQLQAKERYVYRQISQKEGLTSTVNCIYKEKDGDVWIGSPSGLYRFNGYNLSQNEDPLLAGHSIYKVSIGKNGRLWVLTDEHLLRSRSDEEGFKKMTIPTSDKNLPFYSLLHEEDCIWFGSMGKLFRYTYSDDRVKPFCETADMPEFMFKNIERLNESTLLCCSQDGIILINSETGARVPSSFNTFKEVTSSLIDNRGHIWLGFYNNGIGVFNKDGRLIKSFNTANSSLSNNIVLCMTERNGQIWAGTDGGGINIIDLDDEKLSVLSHIPGAPSSFPAHSIKSIYTDQYGNIWAGSIRDGLISIHQSEMKTYKDVHVGLSGGLSNATILSLYQAKGSDYIWIGTDGGGINRYNPKTADFTHYPNTLKTKVASIASYSEDELALSLHSDRLCLFNKKTGDLRPLVINDDELNYQIRYAGHSINLVNEKGGGLLLVGKAIKRFDRTTGRCTRLHTSDGIKPVGNYMHIGPSGEGVWFHDNNNIYLLPHGAGQIIRKGKLEDGIINAGNPGPRGNLWLATNKGLCRYNIAEGSFSFIESALFQSVTSVICDRSGRVWVGTDTRLYAYLVESNIFAMFGESDGAKPNEYLSQPSLLTEAGDILMGGVQGLLHIESSYSIDTSEEPTLALAGLIVDQNPITVTPGKTIRLPRHSKTMNMSISVLEKDMFRNKRYRFYLSDEGMFQTKTPVLSIRQMPPAGTYDVSVSCTKRNGQWTEPTKLLRMKIPQPWYLTGWFIGGCLSVMLFIFFIILFAINKSKADQLKMAMQEQEQTVYEEKVRMLINISHELRTPLTLIMAPLKRLTAKMDNDNEYYPTLSRIYRQSRRMRDLLNMVLDLRKMEVGSKTLKIESMDFHKWLTQTTDDIVKEEKEAGIEIIYKLDDRITNASIDKNKCDTVLMNILMNAIKHSSPGDRITVVTQLLDNGMIRTSISDEGPGLGKDITDTEKLFTPFYQSTSEQYGTGIGLSYSKVLLEMLGGKIGAFNNETRGATFWWEIPVQNERESAAEIPAKAYLNELLGNSTVEDAQAPESESFNTSGMKLLLVDDSTDLLEFLREALSQDFAEIMTATSGNRALKLISNGKLPDIIVSDVNMPDGDGYRLCSELKGNDKYSHIPVVLLTARGEEKSQGDSFRMGADAFLAKPFEIETLMEVLRSLLKSKSAIRKRYFDKEEQAQGEYGSNEEMFIIQLNKIIADHMGDPDLDQQLICRELGVSRALLYNKMKAITGTGAKEYITRIRIEKAKNLMETTNLSIADISEMTGFSAQSYFSTAFKNYTGLTPTKYKQQLKETKTE